jgi:hypothetical protein
MESFIFFSVCIYCVFQQTYKFIINFLSINWQWQNQLQTQLH